LVATVCLLFTGKLSPIGLPVVCSSGNGNDKRKYYYPNSCHGHIEALPVAVVHLCSITSEALLLTFLDRQVRYLHVTVTVKIRTAPGVPKVLLYSE
jgi:hypothetical protein